LTRNESEVSDGTPQSSSLGSGQEGTIVAAETVESRKNRYLFRGDDNYRGGPVGFSLGEEADAADIQDAAEHVLRKESQRTSRYTSFTMETKIARKFTSAPDNRYVHKVELLVLRELERQGFIRIWNAEQVHAVLRQGPKKLANQAADVRAAMRKNREILIEGRIPEGALQPVN
jgi:hypothetical protein